MLHKYMKLAILMTFGLTLILVGCGPKKTEVAQEEPSAVVDSTETDVVTDTIPEPEPPRVLKETEFQTVYFDLDKFNLRSDTRSTLDENLGLLSEFTDVIIKIEGHCDERGTIEYNLSLGDKRANAVMDYLLAQGIDAARISTISYGKERPVSTGSDETAWSANRRCEFRIVSQ